MLEWPVLKYYASPDSTEPKGVIDCKAVRRRQPFASYVSAAARCRQPFAKSRIRCRTLLPDARRCAGVWSIGGRRSVIVSGWCVQVTLSEKFAKTKTGRENCFGQLCPHLFPRWASGRE